VELTVGEHGYFRAVTAADFDITENTSLLIALEVNTFDGPWVLDQDLEKWNGFAKLTHDAGPWYFDVSVTAYDSSWTATDQVPLRAVESGQIDRFGFIDPDLGGNTSRYGLTGNARYTHDDGAETVLQAYYVNYDFTLFSNFTYFLDDPINGDEFEQLDNRSYMGLNLSHMRDVTDQFRIRFGSELRYDDISDLGLFKTAGRERLSTVRRDRVDEVSLSFWTEAEYDLTSTLRATIGLRGDYYDADVTSLSEPLNSGSADDSLFSPSAGLAWRAAEGIEFYANYGRGFHSNDVRGATITIDPLSGAPASQVPILVRAEGFEIGARFERGPFHMSVALFSLELDSELVFVGDAGTTEASDASTRKGIEASLFWKPNDWFVADLSAAYTDANFDIPGSETKIPGAVETVFGGGVLVKQDQWTFSARLRHFGAAPLIEDGSVKSEPTILVNLAASYDWQKVTLSLEVLNIFDAEDADITYFFESQLAGEASPVEDIHFHPVEPRQVRFSLRYNF